MKTKAAPTPTKQWKTNERCLCNDRRAFFLKYTHNGRRAAVNVCVARDGGEISNWKNENVPLTDLREYPNPMPAGFWWDESGSLCFPNLSPLRDATGENQIPADDSPNPTTGENQIPADDSPNLTTGENQIPAENDSPNSTTGENQIPADDSPNPTTGENQIPADDSPNLTTGENQIPADDSPNLTTGENQIPADDSPNLTTGENQIPAENDSPNSSMLEEKNAPGELLEYAPAGKARAKSKYFAFRYRTGGKEKWLHIRGGNVQNSAARERAAIVRRAIDAGVPVEMIVNLIKSF